MKTRAIYLIKTPQGYYGGYTDRGPKFAETYVDAVWFESKEQASRLPAGDERLKAHTIEEMQT